jgi:hypothetical protein
MLIFERLAYHEMRQSRSQRFHRDDTSPGTIEDRQSPHSAEENDAIQQVEVREDLEAIKALGEPLTWEMIHVSFPHVVRL